VDYYKDRAEAGRVLAEALKRYAGRSDLLVLGLPRGGVPVAVVVAEALGARLDVLVVKKLGVPGFEELAMGAVATGGARVLNEEVVQELGVSQQVIERAAQQATQEVQRRERVFRDERPLPEMRGRCVILVDDGLATGSTMQAAVSAVRQHGPAQVVVAVPVAPQQTVESLRTAVDDVVCPLTPESFGAVSQWYLEFPQVADEEVRDLLARAWGGRPKAAGRAKRESRPGRGVPERDRYEIKGPQPGAVWERRVRGMSDRVSGVPESRGVVIPHGEVELRGDLVVPVKAEAIVVFAHGSGSSRFSRRNRFVARTLAEAGLATLLFDLLTEQEEEIDAQTLHLRFDIGLLTARLTGTVDWLTAQPGTGGMRVGLFGASTGAAAALRTAAERPESVEAVVSRGGRPDLAGDALPRVKAPTLLIVGGDDVEVLELNRRAGRAMRAPHKIEVVPGATHLFEEPGKLEEVARLACQWFTQHLCKGSRG
jgi:putative phosphoribosyl transferase